MPAWGWVLVGVSGGVAITVGAAYAAIWIDYLRNGSRLG